MIEKCFEWIIFFSILGAGAAVFLLYNYHWNLKEKIKFKEEKLQSITEDNKHEVRRLQFIIQKLVYYRSSVEIEESEKNCKKKLHLASGGIGIEIDLPPVPKVRRLK